MVLPDLPHVRRLLEDLRGAGVAGDPGGPATVALDRLDQAGLLLADPSRDAELEAARRPVRVTLSGPRALTDAVAGGLRAAGAVATPHGDLHVLLAHGALRRDRTDPLVREGVPHLVAVATPWGWDLGPLVVPGLTACLRCVDAALGERDPRHAVVVDQVARAAPPVQTSPPLLAIAVGWLVRDVVAYARGGRPTTWSASVRLSEAPEDQPWAVRTWLRHPHCGCAWDALAG